MSLRKVLKVAVAVVVVVVVVQEGADGLPGTYTTYGPLRGKWLPPTAAVAWTKDTFEGCTQQCQKHEVCNAFAYSRMEGSCVMYAKGRNNKAVKIDGFTLFVQTRDASDGFFLYNSFYLKLERQRLTPKEAQMVCDRKYYGSLAIVENEDMNHFMAKMLIRPTVFEATIGLTDEAREGHWVDTNGQDVGYTNWNWKGMWRLKDRNCAAMTIDGTWIMTDCWQPDYYFCQVPLY